MLAPSAGAWNTVKEGSRLMDMGLIRRVSFLFEKFANRLISAPRHTVSSTWTWSNLPDRRCHYNAFRSGISADGWMLSASSAIRALSRGFTGRQQRRIRASLAGMTAGVLIIADRGHNPEVGDIRKLDQPKLWAATVPRSWQWTSEDSWQVDSIDVGSCPLAPEHPNPADTDVGTGRNGGFLYGGRLVFCRNEEQRRAASERTLRNQQSDQVFNGQDHRYHQSRISVRR